MEPYGVGLNTNSQLAVASVNYIYTPTQIGTAANWKNTAAGFGPFASP
jgi:hypothetical protein